ncbi:MAG: sensor histidine kinase [Acidobacteriota bacterium]
MKNSRSDPLTLFTVGQPRRRLRFERRILLLAVLTGLPGSLVALVLLWSGPYSVKVQWTLTLFVVSLWAGFAFMVREKVVFPLHTLSNLLAALRERDYSIRARGANSSDALGELVLEANLLGENLREQRLEALEATTLLRKVMSEIDVAVFTFDSDRRLRLTNRAGERLLGQPEKRLMGKTAEALELEDCLEGRAIRTFERTFPAGPGRWEMRRTAFRAEGMRHQLLVIANLSRALREEERQAWQRLIRVLGHELNNSLAPIKSMAATLENLVARRPQPEDWQKDVQRGLSVIGSRADALSRFMRGYSQLARLPAPELENLEIGDLVRRVVGLEGRTAVRLERGPEVTVQADAAQLEQLLINLLRNAVDAVQETRGGVFVGWQKNGASLEVWIRDEGPGLPSSANLFVPFFTTKPAGSGIGLALSRQIAEAHGGTLTLENRPSSPGCEARLRLPLK